MPDKTLADIVSTRKRRLKTPSKAACLTASRIASQQFGGSGCGCAITITGHPAATPMPCHHQ
jgi:hypothetical protein